MRQQDRKLLEDTRQMAKILRIDLDELVTDLHNLEAKLEGTSALLSELYIEVQNFKRSEPERLLKAVQVPEDKAEQMKREKESTERMKARMGEDAEGSS